MSRQYIKNQVLPFLLINQNGELLFNHEQLKDDTGELVFKHFHFVKQLGHGANAVTFVVRHKLLNIEQLVKLYFIERDKAVLVEKALTESRKNSLVALSDSIARVYDLGIIRQPVVIVFSVMEFVENSITLKEYIDKRNESLDILKKIEPEECLLKKESLFGPLFQESINIASYFLRSVSYLVKNNIRHGDLNPGNILIGNSIFSIDFNSKITEYFRLKSETDEESKIDLKELRELLSYYNNNFINHIKVGEISQDGLQVKLIDLGASQVGPSTIKKTNQRDSWLIYDTINQLLSPLWDEIGIDIEKISFFKVVTFRGGPIKKLEYSFPLEQFSETGNYYNSRNGENIPIGDGKVILDEFKNPEDLKVELIKNKEIFSNMQVLPHRLQAENIEKEIMFDDRDEYCGQIPYQMLAGELLKLVGVINAIYGLLFIAGSRVDYDYGTDPLALDIRNLRYYNSSPDNWKCNNFTISPIFDYKFHEAGNLLLNPNSEGKLWCGDFLINYRNLFDMVDAKIDSSV